LATVFGFGHDLVRKVCNFSGSGSVTAVLEQAMATAVKPHDVAHRRRGHRIAMVSAIGAAAMLVLAGTAAAQTRTEPPKPASDPPAATPAPLPPSPPGESPGFVGVFGNWVQQGMSSMSNGIDAMFGAAKGAADAASTVAKGAADVAKGAADAAVDTAAGVTKLPVPGVAGGHEQCTLAGNGAPDCRVAAEALCRARGFATGTSVDFVTSEKCQPPYRSSGRDTPEGACTLEHFVTRALCK
jgi:hypothetical protein